MATKTDVISSIRFIGETMLGDMPTSGTTFRVADGWSFRAEGPSVFMRWNQRSGREWEIPRLAVVIERSVEG